MFEKEVNARITEIRKQRKLSKKDIAERLNLNYSTYVRMESEGSINTDILKKLAEILEVDVRLILYGEVPKAEVIYLPAEPEKPKRPEIIHGYKFINESLSNMEMCFIRELRRLSLSDIQEIFDLIEKKVTGK